jgi:hypothetical protein
VNEGFTSVADRPHRGKVLGHLLAVIGLGVTACGALPVCRNGGEVCAGLNWFCRHDLAIVLFHYLRVAEDRGECLCLSNCRVIDMTAHHAHVFVHCDNLMYPLLAGNINILSFSPY